MSTKYFGIDILSIKLFYTIRGNSAYFFFIKNNLQNHGQSRANPEAASTTKVFDFVNKKLEAVTGGDAI